MTEALAPDPDAALGFLDILRPGGPWVLTAITPDGPTTTETFYRPDTAATWIVRQNAERNIYVMVAEAAGTLRKKAEKRDIKRARHFWADADGDDDLNSRLNGHVPPPTTIVASGGGLNLYWSLTSPIEDQIGLEAHNRWLSQELGADHCWNCDRILRLPGTINHPNAKKKRQGRVPVLARCIGHFPDRIYSSEDFGRVEADERHEATSRNRVDLGDDIVLLKLDDLPAEVKDALPAFAKRLIREGPGPGEYLDDRSKAVLAVTCALVRADATDNQIAGILLNAELPIHAHIREQRGHGPRMYAARQIERARDRVKKDAAAPEAVASTADTGWPDPIDFLADPQLTALASVDDTCLPRSILALARAEGARLQVDPCHIAALTIGACSAVLSDDWRVQLKVNDQGWTQHPVIWVAVVAESGRKKTDCFKVATRGIFKIEQRLREEHAKAMAKHMEEHARWEALPKADRGQEPKPPAELRLATDDFTPEILCDLLQDSHKVLLRSDELATVLGAYERYQKAGSVNAGRAHMLALYDGGPRRIDRVVRGKMFVENWSAVPVGHIQPAKVRALVDGLSDDGLLQRFMIVMPPRADLGDPDDDDIITDWTAIDRFAQILETLFALRPPETQGPGGKPEYCRVEADQGAHRIRRRLFRLIERIEADFSLPAPLKEATSKWRGLLARLSLLFHCIELAEAKIAGERPDPITVRALKSATVEKACRFIMRVVVPSTFRFHTEIGSTSASESHARWVAGYLLSRKLESITARDIGRAYREIRGNRAEIVNTMAMLDHAGWVSPHPDRPRDTAWLVNPKIHTAFTAQAAAERARREAVRAQLGVSIAELTQ